MIRNNKLLGKRFIVLALIISLLVTIQGLSLDVEAATNLVTNGDFENGSLSPWSGYGVGVANYGAYAGSKCLYVEGTREAQQTITGLSASTTYELSAYVKVGNAGDKIVLGARDYGSSVSEEATTAGYSLLTMTFTTGANNTSATIYVSRQVAGQWSWGYADEITLVETGSQPATDNLAQNPSFESGTSNWQLDSKFSVVSGNALTGSNALKMTGTGSWQNAYQVISVDQNTDYTVSFYAKGTGATQLKIFTSSWSDLGATTKWPGSNYSEYQLNFNSASHSSIILAFQDASTGTLYIDDVVVTGGSTSTTPGPIGPSGTWNLTFSDEFTGSALDTAKWTVGWPWGDTAGHADEVIRSQNVSLNNGIMTIKANKEGDTWYSGLIQTNGKHNQEYGYWEARIKTVNNTPGFLSAFWACTNEHWPPEIDFVEVLGNDTTKAHVTQHYTDSQGQYGVDGYEWNAGVDLSQDYHVYGCEWDSSQIKYYIDGNLVATFQNQINEPLYTLLNMHVGMDWTGDPTTTQDQYMYVDWVRVWQK